jgi:hypothetical protein
MLRAVSERCGYYSRALHIAIATVRSAKGAARAKWMDAEQATLLPVEYFHVVFTLPHALNPLLRVNPRRLYSLLFRTAAATGRGFARLSQGTVRQEASPDVATYLTKIASRVYSDLALISEEAFARGIARMQEAGTSLGSGPVQEDVDYFVFQRAA